MSSKNILIDIRASDEVLTKRFDDSKMTNFYNIPMNMIRFNRRVILNHLEYVDNIYLVCSTSRRSKIIKDKYFPNEDRIKVNKALSFKYLPDVKGMHIVELGDGIVEKVYLTGTFGFNLYNMTRFMQVFVGTVMLICGLFLLKYKTVHFLIKTLLVGFGIVLLFSGITASCFMALLLQDYMN